MATRDEVVRVIDAIAGAGVGAEDALAAAVRNLEKTTAAADESAAALAAAMRTARAAGDKWLSGR